MMNHLLVNGNWVSDGVFAAFVEHIKLDYSKLTAFVDEIKASLMVDVVLAGVVEHRSLTAYDFAGYAVQVRCQKSYIDLLTSGANDAYQFKYVPEEKVICIFDEDGLIGFVMRLKNENEE